MGSLAYMHWLILAAIFLLPPILVLLSPKVHGLEKFGWSCLALFFSWFGFVIFMVVQSLRVPQLRRTDTHG